MLQLDPGELDRLDELRRMAHSLGPYDPERDGEPYSCVLPGINATVFYGQRCRPELRRLIVICRDDHVDPRALMTAILDHWFVTPLENALAGYRMASRRVCPKGFRAVALTDWEVIQL